MRTFISQTLNAPYPEGFIYLGIWVILFIFVGMFFVKGFILFFTSGFYKIVLYLVIGFIATVSFFYFYAMIFGV